MEVISQLDGAFALLIKSTYYPDELIACKKGSPLLLGARHTLNRTVRFTHEFHITHRLPNTVFSRSQMPAAGRCLSEQYDPAYCVFECRGWTWGYPVCAQGWLTWTRWRHGRALP